MAASFATGVGPRHSLRRLWIAVVSVDVALVASAALLLVAFVRELDCLFDCSAEEEETGAGFWLLGALAAVVLGGGFALAARTVGVPGWSAVRRGSLGVLVVFMALVAWGVLPSSLDLAGLTVGVALAGSIAIPPLVPRAWRARGFAIVAVAIASVLAQAVGNVGLAYLALLSAVPALAIADTVALRRRPVAGS